MTDDPSADDLEAPELTQRERQALAAWRAPALGAELVDRVMAGHAGAPSTPMPATAPAAAAPRRQRSLRRAAVLGAALVAALGVYATLRPSAPAPRAGAVTATARTTAALGGRALAVLEPETTLAWSARGGAVEVDQPSGNAFYRVDKGGAFVVRTPAGTIRVTGTCFRIEVISMKHKQAMFGGLAGAALSAAVIVTVYEGGVVVAGSRGQAQVAAGERVVAAQGQVLSAEESTALSALAAPPPPDASREALLARDVEQRRHAERLAARVAELEAKVTEHVAMTPPAPPAPPAPGDGARKPDAEPTQDELVQWAKTCKVSFDFPPMAGRPMQLSPATAKELGLSEEEARAAERVFAQQRVAWLAKVRAIYVEVVGEVGNLDELSLQAMTGEIHDKGTTDADESELRRRLAQERAGLATPPADLRKAGAFERYFRGLVGLGDEAEALLAKELGPERARALRKKNGGWGSRMSMDGCSNEPEGAEPSP